MEEWKERLMRLGQEEQRRERQQAQADAEYVEHTRQFIAGIARPALDEVAEVCAVLNRNSRRGLPNDDSVSLAILRKDRPELTFIIEVRAADSVVLRVRNDQGAGERFLSAVTLLAKGETIDDLTQERIRNAVVRQLERRLKGEI